ncbi:MAG: hypothetical protein EOP31_22255 [Rhodococcus sp. (in: high G+C Gram-positive bacteria)]|uniref:O-antigen ligase family protein n=1 Tax=Rhodococcus sp. TaxID=1831 RepID=UPI001210B928|nr:hypothetical protein [Rhodococcus sp. (in: high G+C Gram-positive bacteria)]RZL22688.1 MAG: hypothetical protein EOP31_22255 [Rhodococcus sp. (in: high G+C Gram-positive bacteria)]
MTLIAVIAGLSSIGIIAACAGRLHFYFLFLFLVSVCIFPKALYVFGTPKSHAGITSSAPSIWTYSVVLIIFAGYALVSRRDLVAKAWLPLVIVTVLFSMFIWDMTDLQISGALHLLTATLASGLGVYCFKRTPWIGGRRDLMLAVFLVALLEFTVCVSQLFQFSVPFLNSFSVNDITAETTAGRIAGTTDHPGTLGKIVFLLIIVCLPSVASSDLKTKVLSITSIVLLATPLIFSEGRANFIAVLILLISWPFTSALVRATGQGSSKRLLIGLSTALVGVASFGIYAARFSEDPVGGPRERLLDVALIQIPMRLWTGTGPNSYVEVVGSYDRLTSLGWPVHSAPLLAIAELGIIGGICVLLPFFVLTWRALHVRSLKGFGAESAVVWISATPGFVIIGTTGWGLLGGAIFILYAFVVGYFSESLRQKIQVSSVASGSASSSTNLVNSSST